MDPLGQVTTGGEEQPRRVGRVGDEPQWQAVGRVHHRAHAGDDEPDAAPGPGGVELDGPRVPAAVGRGEAERAHGAHGVAVPHLDAADTGGLEEGRVVGLPHGSSDLSHGDGGRDRTRRCDRPGHGTSSAPPVGVRAASSGFRRRDRRHVLVSSSSRNSPPEHWLVAAPPAVPADPASLPCGRTIRSGRDRLPAGPGRGQAGPGRGQAGDRHSPRTGRAYSSGRTGPTWLSAWMQEASAVSTCRRSWPSVTPARRSVR